MCKIRVINCGILNNETLDEMVVITQPEVVNSPGVGLLAQLIVIQNQYSFFGIQNRHRPLSIYTYNNSWIGSVIGLNKNKYSI